MGGRRQRRPRRAAQDQLGVAAAHEVGDVGVALADRLGLDRPAGRGRARRGAPRAGAAPAAAGGRGRRPPPGCRRSRSRGRRVCRRRREAETWEGSVGFGYFAPLHAQTPPPHPPGAARRLPGGGVGLEHAVDDLRGAARAARRRHARPHAAGGAGLRRRPRARARLLEGLRARPDLEAAPGLRRDRSERLPRRRLGPPRRAVRLRTGARHHGPAHAHRPGPALGHVDQARLRDAAEHEGVPGLRHRGGRRFGDRVGVWSIWNEPNHPQFLLPQFVKKHAKSPRIYRNLFLAGQRGLAASGNGGDLAAVRRDRAARHAARRRAARLPARRAVPRPQLPPQGPLQAHRGRRLRPPRLHDARRAALPPAGSRRRDDRRALAADEGARPRGARGRDSRAASAST